MVNPQVTKVKLDFLIDMVLKPGTLSLIIALRNGDLSYREIREMTTLTKPHKTLHILGITRRHKNEDGILVYGLTKRGKILSQALTDLMSILDEVLPGEE